MILRNCKLTKALTEGCGLDQAVKRGKFLKSSSAARNLRRTAKRWTPPV